MGPFATATEFCEWTGMAVPSDLSRLQALLQSASDLIRGYTGQVLHEVVDDEVTIQPWFVGDRLLFLPEAPVTAVTSVEIEAAPFTDYIFTEAGELVRMDGQAWFEPVTVTYTHGYPESSSEFQQIRLVCIQMTKRAYTADESGQALFQGGVPAETVGFPMALFLTEQEGALLPNPAPAAVG